MIKSLLNKDETTIKSDSYSMQQTPSYADWDPRADYTHGINVEIEHREEPKPIPRHKSASNRKMEGDVDGKVEKALLDLNEFKSNFVVQEKQAYEHKMFQA